jgi:CBS domain-containing protein
MSVGRICTRIVETAAADDSVRVASNRMKVERVGTLVVLDSDGRPEGIVTDRDIALRVVGERRDPDTTPLSAVMTSPVDAINEDTTIDWALHRMADRGVRRLVVVDDEGMMSGLLSMDDVLALLIEEAQDVGSLLRQQLPA